jgi:biotin operon repressor
MRNIVGDRVEKSRRAVEALVSVLEGRGIPINVRTSMLMTRIVPVLTYG